MRTHVGDEGRGSLLQLEAVAMEVLLRRHHPLQFVEHFARLDRQHLRVGQEVSERAQTINRPYDVVGGDAGERTSQAFLSLWMEKLFRPDMIAISELKLPRA